jgi:hypothetical protein
MSEQNIRSIVVDFTTDLTVVFPEYAFLWERWLTADDAEYEKLNQHFLSVFPERFFDITNSNAEIFAPDSTVNTMFLPDVDFKLLFNCAGVSENTKTSMWKYLQLLLFTVIGSVKDSSNFGDAMKMFESMDENDLQSKMQETMDGLGDFFKGFATEGAANEGSDEGSNEGLNEGPNEGETKGFKLPKPEVLHEHMRTLMEGKLGKLAKELTEEFTEDLKGVFDETDQNMSMKDIMAQIMKDPKKIMHIMKKITDKLQNKMKNGDISQDELMKEVAGLVEKFKGMGVGGDDFVKNFASGPFAKMFKNMAGQAMAGQAMGNQNLSKHSAMKERLRKKMEDKKQKQSLASASSQVQAQVQAPLPLRPNSFVVKIGDEKQEKSGLAPPSGALSEEELVALFKTRNKKGKKTKN